ncbi:MAG: glycosyltransferase family 39 protein [Candidatus Eisenbacteria bacterium]
MIQGSMEPFGHPPIFSFLLATATVIGCAGLGNTIIDRLSLRGETGLARLLPAVGIGIGVFSLLLFALGAARILRSETAFALLLLLLAISYKGRSRLRLLHSGIRARDLLSRGVNRAFIVIGAACFLFALVGASAPPTESDCLTYHLPVAATYAREGAIVGLGDTIRYSVFPQLIEMLFAFGFLTTGVFFGQFVNVFFGVLVALAAAALVREIAGEDDLALAAGVLVYAFPSVAAFSTRPLVDLPLAFYLLIEVLAVLRWVRTGNSSWMIAAGLAAGFALAVKYSGGVAVFLPVAAAFLARREGRPRALALFGAVSLLPALPWLARNFVETGNPVSPFQSGVFHGTNLDAFTAGELRRHLGDVAAHSARERLLLIRDLSFHHSPVILALLPVGLLLRSAWSRARALVLLWGGFLFVLSDLLLPHEWRFFLAPAVLLTAWSVACIPHAVRALGIPGPLLIVIVLVPCVLPNGAIVAREMKKLPVAVGLEAKDDYLRRRLDFYAVCECARSAIGPEARILSLQENRRYYFPGETAVATSSVRASFAYTMTDGEAAVEEMRTRGFTHLLINGNPYWRARRISTPLDDPSLLNKRFRPVCEANNVSLYELLPGDPLAAKP